MARILIENGWVVPVDGTRRTLPGGAVAVDGGRIVAVGDIPADFRPDHRVDAAGKAVLPGFVNTHIHFVGAYNKATTEDARREGGNSFKRGILFQEDHVGSDDVFLPGVLHGLEALRTGTTTANEMWWHQPESARIAKELGIRAVIGGVVREMNTGTIDPARNARDWVPAIADKDLADCEAMIETWHGAEDGRITCRVAPDGPDRMRPETMDRCRELARKFGVGTHMHVASVPAEQGFMEKAYGKRAIKFLHEHGALGPDCVAVHCVFIDEEEVELLAETGTKLSHTAYLVGKRGYYPPMDRVYRAGIPVSLGTDWMSNDMFKVMRAALMLGRVTSGDQGLIGAWDVLAMATRGGADALGMEDETGSLEPGKKADLILLDMTTPWVAPVRAENMVANLVYNANGSDVTDVMVDGRWLVRDRRHAWIDEKVLIAEVQAMADRVWAEARPLFEAKGA